MTSDSTGINSSTLSNLLAAPVIYINVGMYIKTTKGVDLSGLGRTQKKTGGLGDGSPPAASRGGAPVGGLGNEVPQKLPRS